MKTFKEFKSEQQHISEIGPIGTAIAGAMGLAGLGFAGYKLFKKAKEGIKGYRETKADKKARAQDGFTMSVKVYNPETDKEESQDFYIDPKDGNKDLEKITGGKFPEKTLTGKYKAPSDDELDKMEKEANRKAKRANVAIKRKIKSGDYTPDDLTADQQTQLADKEKEDKEEKKEKKAKEKRAGIEDVKDAEEYFDNNNEAPPGWRNAGTKEKPELMTRSDYEKEMARRKRVGKQGPTPDERKKQAATKAKLMKRKKEREGGVDIKKQQFNSKLLNFANFIKEDVMKELKKASKSRKDSEITLDDGADIPIDPLTSQILVKYIEGLSSSEKNKTIKQIQRTERAFLKVLGKAHEG